MNALLQIIQLHKPEGNKEQQCAHCKRAYPCPTVQIIQKELV